jgi:hypothetical protein
MTFVDPGAIGECGFAIGPTEDAAARRRVRPGDTMLMM